MSFIKKRIKGLIIAISGMFFLLKNEDSIKVQSLFFLLFIFLGYYFEITTNEWIIHIILIGFILTAEALNTVAEKICDFINPKYDDRIKLIKDITISFFLITLTIVVIRISLKYSDIKSEVNDCQKIKFGNKATAIVCQQTVELTNNYSGKTQELATSIAQATAISALEYLYKNIAVFRPLLNEYRIF